MLLPQTDGEILELLQYGMLAGGVMAAPVRRDVRRKVEEAVLRRQRALRAAMLEEQMEGIQAARARQSAAEARDQRCAHSQGAPPPMEPPTLGARAA